MKNYSENDIIVVLIQEIIFVRNLTTIQSSENIKE